MDNRSISTSVIWWNTKGNVVEIHKENVTSLLEVVVQFFFLIRVTGKIKSERQPQKQRCDDTKNGFTRGRIVIVTGLWWKQVPGMLFVTKTQGVDLISTPGDVCRCVLGFVFMISPHFLFLTRQHTTQGWDWKMQEDTSVRTFTTDVSVEFSTSTKIFYSFDHEIHPDHSSTSPCRPNPSHNGSNLQVLSTTRGRHATQRIILSISFILPSTWISFLILCVN